MKTLKLDLSAESYIERGESVELAIVEQIMPDDVDDQDPELEDITHRFGYVEDAEDFDAAWEELVSWCNSNGVRIEV